MTEEYKEIMSRGSFGIPVREITDYERSLITAEDMMLYLEFSEVQLEVEKRTVGIKDRMTWFRIVKDTVIQFKWYE
jgi:hypothetical protein